MPDAEHDAAQAILDAVEDFCMLNHFPCEGRKVVRMNGLLDAVRGAAERARVTPPGAGA